MNSSEEAYVRNYINDLGTTPGGVGLYNAYNIITLNGSTTLISLTGTPNLSYGLFIYKNGVLLEQGIDYTVLSFTVTFLTTYPNGTIIQVYFSVAN